MRARSLLQLGLAVTFVAVTLVGFGPAGPSASAPVAAQASQERGGQDEFGPYEPVLDWPKPLTDGQDGVRHAGWTWGSVGGIYAESPDRIWVAMRGELPLPADAKPWTPYGLLTPPRNATGNPDGVSATCEPTEKRGWERRFHHSLIVFDRNGNVVEDWAHYNKMSEGACGRGPHKVKMSPYDPQKHVWVIDDQLHTIYKFTRDGKLVMTLGTKGQRGRDTGKLFDRPTDIDWLPDGTFFISDGYGGKRVAKFDKDGKFLTDWGSAPKDPAKPGPNEWNTVHSIAISKDRRLFVVDRGHRRFQIFDENGKFLDMFSTGTRSSPYFHLITADQNLWVSDGGTNRIVRYDLNGKYLDGWGGPGPWPGYLDGPHQFSVDQEGNLYVAEVFNGRVQKYRPRAGADKSRLISQEVRLGSSN